MRYNKVALLTKLNFKVMKTKRLLYSLTAVAFLLVFLASPAWAAEVLGPTKDNPNVSTAAQENHKNLYAAGANVTVNGETGGDLSAAGGTVTVSGKVDQEAMIAGGNLVLSGEVGSHARLLGGNITVSAPIGGDLAVAGGNINLTSKASIGGDLLIAGGNIDVEAPVQGDVRIAGGDVTLNGKVGGNVYVRSSRRLFLGSSAEIAGKVEYSAPQSAVISSGAKTGPISYTQISTGGYMRTLAGFVTVAFLVKFLAWLLAAFVAIKVRKNFIMVLGEEFKAKPWANLGVGFLVFIAAPVAVALLLLSFVGYYLAILLGALYLLLLVAANLLSALVFGYFLLSLLNKPGEMPVDWQAIVIGVVVWLVLPFIPILGWAVMFVVFLMVLGAGIKKLKFIS